MKHTLERLPVLILSPHGRCNCRCLMCDIWKTTDAPEMTAQDLSAHLASIENLGVEWAVFTGGEPLMHKDLFRLCAELKTRGIRTTLLSTGLLLSRYAEEIVEWIDDVIVSLDGPPAVHDRIRGVPSAFASLAAGAQKLHALRPGFRITARCTVQRSNCASLIDTAEAARAIGLSGISFLAADVTSEAFNRAGGWQFDRQSSVAPAPEQIPVLQREVAALSDPDRYAGFVAESPAKLQKIVDHFRAHLGLCESVAPRCNAPWVSAVVEADGTVRPCFFHPPIGKATAREPLITVLSGSRAVEFRQHLEVATDPVCRRCVCSLNWRGSQS